MILNTILAKLFGTSHEREVKRILPIVDAVNSHAAAVEILDDEALVAKTVELRAELANGKSLDDILPEAFAVCREAADRRLGMLNILNPELKFDFERLSSGSRLLAEAARQKLSDEAEETTEHHTLLFPASFYAEIRTLQPESRFPFRYRPFDVQLIGGVVLHEGKTVVATLPVYLNALEGRGVHVVTVNDYLATRDAETMGKVYKFLGLTVGIIVHGLTEEQRKGNYAADVTYGTNNEFGFDYLRDNMAHDIEDCVQRDLNFAIVDEVDSILIDEARTPLIISGPAEESTDKYRKANEIIRFLVKDTHYTLDEKDKHVALTEEGVNVCEEHLGLENLYADTNVEWVHHVQQALKSHAIFKRDVDYVVRNRQIMIVDEFTGRLMEGRRYSDGLHQAIEAKEGLNPTAPTEILARLSFQRFYRGYRRLSGMSGTAREAAAELWQIYGLPVIAIPTHRPCIRTQWPQLTFADAAAKWRAVVDEIAAVHASGRPVLVGTRSVAASEELALKLGERGLNCQVLNAVRHAEEAQIVAQAGTAGRITIATNMAGRGTDILLGHGSTAAGGLHVIASEPNDSGRVDRQLFGRAGRQGSPGSARLFVSLEDDLVQRFLPATMRRQVVKMLGRDGKNTASAAGRGVVRYGQFVAQWQAARQRSGVLRNDTWLEEALSFSGPNAGG